MPHRRPPKLATAEYRGGVRIFLTMCTFNRARAFETQAIVDVVHGQFLHTCSECGVETIAHCYMPDHLHALVCGTRDDSDGSRFATLFRQRAGYATRPLVKRKLWQEGYFDRHLRNVESTFDVVSYIVANPVRAGLCAHPREYPFLGSSSYSLDELNLAVQWKPC